MYNLIVFIKLLILYRCLHDIICETFPLPPKDSLHFFAVLFLFPWPLLSPRHLLCVIDLLFCSFTIKEIIQLTVFQAWTLSLSITLRFNCFIVWIRISGNADWMGASPTVVSDNKLLLWQAVVFIPPWPGEKIIGLPARSNYIWILTAGECTTYPRKVTVSLLAKWRKLYTTFWVFVMIKQN